uniref:Uncharacterized protein n=1 Tax=Klebsiella pneumoniae TaxID=573 RepID=A0A3G4RJB6_KLEPN|nr:hypothetical protein [Klebsiella pneumoniae]
MPTECGLFSFFSPFGKTPSLPNCALPPPRSDFLMNFFLTQILLSGCFYTLQVRARCRCRTLASCCRRRDRKRIHSVNLNGERLSTKTVDNATYSACISCRCYHM